jgi:N-methylhydantoinase A/oxoprolinase/acetone carboxylase beta subunit
VDPRDFALLAFGGAGGLHAAAIAEELGMRRILVPAAGGVLSALGLAAAERRAHVQRTVLLRGEELTDDALAAARDELGREALATLGTREARGRTVADARYRGQSHELTVPGGGSAGELREAFETAHDERYGYREDGGEVELVTLRVTMSIPGPQLSWEAEAAEAPGGVIALEGSTAYVPDGWRARFDDTGTLVMER